MSYSISLVVCAILIALNLLQLAKKFGTPWKNGVQLVIYTIVLISNLMKSVLTISVGQFFFFFMILTFFAFALELWDLTAQKEKLNYLTCILSVFPVVGIMAVVTGVF